MASQWLPGDEYDSVMNYPLLSGIHDFFLDKTMKKEEFEYRVLIHNRQDFMKVHTDAIVEKADVEDLMLFYIRGERVL